MGYKKIEKTDEEFQIFQDFWKILQDYYEVENTEEYWKSLRNDCSLFGKKYNYHSVAVHLGGVLWNILEDKAKGYKPDDD